jgi:hypothetical protein
MRAMSKPRDGHHDVTQDDGDPRVATIAVEPGRPIDLHVENPNGEIAIRAVDREDVRVTWEKHGRPGSGWYDEANVQVTHEEDNRIEVKVLLPPVWPGGDLGRTVLKFLEGGLKGGNPFATLAGGPVSFDLAVELPRAAVAANPARVRVRTANGDVEIDEVIGSIDVATANGEVVTNGTRGEVSIHAANGDLTLNRPTGRVIARTVSGDLAISGGDLSRFTLNTVNGHATVETVLTGDASRIEGVNGDIRLDLTLPAATGGSLSVRSVSGDARVAPPFRSVAKRTWRIGPGSEGGPSVAVKTVSGDLIARGTLSPDVSRHTHTVAATPPTPPTPPTPQTLPAAPASPAVVTAADDTPIDPRLAVLQAVERGEIDIDEAMSQLDRLGHAD